MRDLVTAIRRLPSVLNAPASKQSQSKLPISLAERMLGGSDYEQIYDAYGSVGTLFAIVSQITNAVASPKWHLYRQSAARDATRRPEVTKHPWLSVWKKPNNHYTNRMLREALQQHLDLVGECVILFVEVGNLIVEMWPIRPDRITPVKDPNAFISGYIYKSPDNEEVPLFTSQILRIMYPNPADPYRGLGPVQSVLTDIDAAKYSAEWNRNFFINGAQPGGIIEVDYRMGDEEFREFVHRWRQQHQGVANAHRVAVLENAKWKDTKFSMEDMQFLELRNLPRELIREAFAFPKPMLGSVDDVNRANADAGREIMAEGQTIPRLDRWQDAFNGFVIPRYAGSDNLSFEYDDPTPVNREAADRERQSKASAAATLVNAGYHPDDVTQAMELPAMRFVGSGVPS